MLGIEKAPVLECVKEVVLVNEIRVIMVQLFPLLRCSGHRLFPAVASSSRAIVTLHASNVANSITSNTSRTPILLDADTALSLHGNQNVKFIDGSWHLDKIRNASEEFMQKHILGAKFMNIDEVADKNCSLPHMLPPVADFENFMTSNSIANDDHIIVYNTHSCFSAPRVWWTLRYFGHDKVSLLNGGFNAWTSVNGPVGTGAIFSTGSPTATPYKAKVNEEFNIDWKHLLAVVETGSAQIVDARSAARFRAEVPEPREGLRSGNIPGSLNIPFTSIMDPKDVTKFKSSEEIRKVFEEAGVVFGSRIIFSCGSGVTAAVLHFGMSLLGIGFENKAVVYDGSWTEWGGREDLPIVNLSKRD